jgi:hypothetical protein
LNNKADLNCDGEIDVTDLNIFAADWLCVNQATPGYQDSCVTWWKFDENTGPIVIDSSGLNNYGTITGASWTTGKIGSALDFEGADTVTMTVNDLSSVTDRITIACWVYGDDVQPQNDHFVVANNDRG